MKNITKQNFKTNPLWIRLLIMTFMLLAGASSVWGDTYLAGSFNSWNASDGNYKFVSGSLSVGMSPGTYEFKIVEDGKWYSMNNTNITATVSTAIKMYENNNNNKITISTAGIYTFTWDATNNKLKVTYPTAKTYTATIKFKRPSSWANTPHIHMFYDGSNTLVNNVAMTKEGVDANGNTWFTYTYNVTTTFTNATIMFNNGGWNNGQTAEQFKGDLGKDYCLASATSTTSTRGDVTTATCPVYCTPPAAPDLDPSSTTVCSGTSFTLPSGYRWYTVATGGTKLSSNTISAGVTAKTTYYAEAGEDGCVSTSRTAYTVNVDPKSALTLKANPTICQGSSIVLSDYVKSSEGTVKWYSNSGMTTEITNPSEARTPQSSPIYYYARATSGVCSSVDKTLTVTFKSAPTKPVVTLSPTDGNIVSGNKATLSVNSPVNGATYTLYEETKGEIETGTSTSFEITEAGTYYVIGTDECGQDSPASESKTITVCTIGSTLNSAEYDAATQKVSLEGTFEFCGKESFHGFQWKKEGSNWCDENVPTDNSAYVMLGKTTEGGTKSGEYTIGDQNSTYVFRTYVVPVGGAWIYGNEITVTPCITVATPNVTAAPVCAGNEAVLTLNNRQNGVTYKLGNTEIFTPGNTYTVTPEKTTTYTITATSAISCVANQKASTDVEVKVIERPEAPKFTSSSTTICEGETIELPTPTNIGSYEIAWSIKDAKNTPVPVTLTETTIFCAVLSNNGCLSTATEFTVNVTPIPTITGATYTQPGKDNAIELTLPAGISAKWSVSPAADLSVNEGNSTMFSAEANGTYTITADNKGCTDTHDVIVSDAFYIWVRNAKENETAYSNFYHSDQNSPKYRGGVMFYAECTELPTNNTYTTYNEGGREADLVQNDCDGYTWYGFRASADVISGSKYFYVRAKNDINNAGWYTHTVPTKVTLTSDVYYTLCEKSVNDCNEGSKGWKIVSTSAPYAGPKVHASGNDFSFNKNNFADFVALYVTDCSGKEVKSYQWQYSATESGNYENYSSVCTYVGKKSEQGDAGKTNNIRPNVAGWYRCTATYKDGSSLTSAAKQVTDNDTKDVANYATFSSDLPIIMVNTNGYGFPSCDGLSGTASKNADVLKAKISVDVKIKLGNDIVYDRKARMNYRGSSSLNFVKKSYAFCPGKADCVEDKGRVDYVKTEKLNMLNVGSAVDKDWVLYAAAADPSIMRNRLVFDTFRDMTGSWSVQSRYVELIVDGEYKGIYVFMDKITNNANRVNITDENGFILKFDKTDIVDRYEGSGDKKTFKSLYSGKDGSGTYDTQIDQRFEIEYPEMEDVEEEEAGKWATTVNNIKSMINNFETQLKAGNYAEVQKIIDYKSWADWFLITEYAKNMDAYRASCLFVYNGDKLEARPLWDQELSFKNYCATLCDDYSCDNAEGLLIRTSKIYEDTESCSAPFWFTGKYVQGRGTEAIGGSQQFVGYLLNDPCFVQTVKDRWNEHKNKALSAESLNAKLERYTNEMATALDREKSIWKSEGGKLSRETCQCSYNGTTGYSDITISDSKGDITEWINARPAELEEALNDEIGTGLSISFSEENINTTPWEPVVLQVHNESGYHYTLTYTDNALDQQAGIIIEKNGDTYKYNIPRPANWGIGDEATEGERANIVYGLKATLQMDSSYLVCGSQAEVPFDEATITLQDEPNENCVQP